MQNRIVSSSSLASVNIAHQEEDGQHPLNPLTYSFVHSLTAAWALDVVDMEVVASFSLVIHNTSLQSDCALFMMR